MIPSQTLTDNGAWCWFSDPRALLNPADGRLHAGWVGDNGDIVVASVDADWSGPVIDVLHEGLEVDDHASPSLAVMPRGDLTAFYSRHSDDRIRFRRLSPLGNPREWSPERWLRLNPPGDLDTYCYPRAVPMPNDDETVFLFWRGVDWKPCLSVSGDDGESWAEGRILFTRPDAGPSNRPYMKVAGDHAGRIHFAITDGHPRDEPRNSIRYCYYEDGEFYGIGDGPIGSLATLPLDPRDLDLVYDGRTSGRAWIWDVAPDTTGAAIVFAVMPEPDRHVYRYAAVRNGEWSSKSIGPAGRWFPQTPANAQEPEPHYSAGVVLNHLDPSTVFLSRPIGGTFELERWSTSDGGDTWHNTPITADSEFPNVRPVVVRGSSPPVVMWMHLDGGYEHYTRFRTSIRFAVVTPQGSSANEAHESPLSDLNDSIDEHGSG